MIHCRRYHPLMAETTPISELNTDFSSPEAVARPWSEVERLLTTAEMFWISTVRADGRPHVTPIPAVWHDGALHICTGDQEQKARNLDHDSRCVLTTGTPSIDSGLDVTVEGSAVRVTDRDRLATLAALWKERLNWDFRVGEDSFDGGGGRKGLVFAVTPAKILAFGKGEPYSQTRYRFPA
jgi:predicted pyridoxine 5'-phosphate oxidase superfamily flavin-nucleotide-binding protein